MLVPRQPRNREAGPLRTGPFCAGRDSSRKLGPDAYWTSMLFRVLMPEIRQDPHFVGLCARLGLVDFWIATDRWPDCADEVSYDFKAGCAAAADCPRDDFGF